MFPVILATITLQPDSAPLWLDVFIWMATFWQFILVGFVPAFYVCVAKLFGMPLLQRWSKEVVIIMYPKQIKLGKIKDKSQPYFRFGKAVFWHSIPLKPEPHFEVSETIENKLLELRSKYEALAQKENKTDKEKKEIDAIMKKQKLLTKRIEKVEPVNTLQIFSHEINQPITHMEKNRGKIIDLLHHPSKPTKLSPHGVWLMQNPRMHFHRHFQLIINKERTLYKLIPVKDRQEFSIGFWHSVGILIEKEVKTVHQGEGESNAGGTAKMQMDYITTDVILESTEVSKDHQNFSSSRAFMLLARRAKLEYNFSYWIQGSVDPRIFLVLGGLVASIAIIFIFLHGGGSTGGTAPASPGGIKPFL